MITIRETVDGDLPALAALRATWAAEQAPAADGTTVDPEAFLAVLKNWLEANPRTFFLAEDEGVPVGMLNLMVFERMPKPGKDISRWVYMGNVYVLPDRRNAGIGAQLVEAALAYSREINAVRMLLSPSSESRSFYARLGFVPAEELNVLTF